MKNYIPLLLMITLLFSANVQSQCLLGYFQFSANFADSSGYSNHGIGTGTFENDRFGNANSACRFNGTTDYVAIPILNSSVFANGITFSAWIYADSFALASVVDKMNQPGNGNGFRLNVRDTTPNIFSDTKVWASSGAYSLDDKAISNSHYSLNGWFFIASSWGTDDSLRVYVNGVKEQTIYSAYSLTNNDSILIGRGHGGIGEFFHGKIDEVRINNCALSDSAITSLYTPNINCLVGYYSFTGGGAVDSSGNGFNGTVHGATLTAGRNGPNSAYHFNGLSDYIELPISNSSLFTAGVTFSVWISADSFAMGSVIDKMNYQGNGTGFRLNVREATVNPFADKKVWSSSGSYAADDKSISTSQYALNNWCFIAGSWGPDDSLRVYFNGNKEQTIFSSYNFTNNDLIYIGSARFALNEFFHGKIDDVRINNCVLSDSEIWQLWGNFGSGISEDEEENSFHLYPNPTTGIVNFSKTFDLIIVYNSMGEKVLKESNSQKIDLSKFSTGLYFVTIKTMAGQIISHKLFKN